MLVLEGAQAGLSWSTILNKRERYRRAFAGFDPVAVARFDRRKRDRLLADPGIVRNRAKVEAAVANAGRTLEGQRPRGELVPPRRGGTAELTLSRSGKSARFLL